MQQHDEDDEEYEHSPSEFYYPDASSFFFTLTKRAFCVLSEMYNFIFVLFLCQGTVNVFLYL